MDQPRSGRQSLKAHDELSAYQRPLFAVGDQVTLIEDGHPHLPHMIERFGKGPFIVEGFEWVFEGWSCGHNSMDPDHADCVDHGPIQTMVESKGHRQLLHLRGIEKPLTGYWFRKVEPAEVSAEEAIAAAV